MQALLGHTSEARWLRYTRAHLHHLFLYLPKQPGYNKRLRRLGATIGWLVGVLARDTTVWTDDVWVVDPPGRVRPVPRDGAALGSGRGGRVRLLRQPLPVLLGAATAPAVPA